MRSKFSYITRLGQESLFDFVRATKARRYIIIPRRSQFEAKKAIGIAFRTRGIETYFNNCKTIYKY
jgi:hypothetical protein